MTDATAEFEYRSKLDGWYDRASVRVKPRRMLADEEAMGRIYFPPELVPVTRHRLVQELGDQAIRRILIQRLHAYLRFTAELEHDVVNRVTLAIAQHQVGVRLPWEMEFDAYKIYCDEGYHALFSVDLVQQVHQATGIGPSSDGMGGLINRLEELLRDVPRELQELARVFFAISSETLISAILADLPKDKRVISTVRILVADHAEDEGRHHSYFAQLLTFLWHELPAAVRQAIGPLLPKFILAILEPDLRAIECELAGCGLTAEQVAQIVHEAYPRSRVIAGIRHSARSTLAHFERTGVLSDPRTLEAFQCAGLI